MKKIYGVFCRIQEILISVIMLAMIAVVLIATFCRYTQTAVLNWPDELTRYLMVWMVFLGAGAASKNNAHFQITAVYDRLGTAGKLVLLCLKMIVCNGMYIFMLKVGTELVVKLAAMGQVSPAMHVPMYVMYLAIPIGLALMMVQGLITDIGSLSGLLNKRKGGGAA